MPGFVEFENIVATAIEDLPERTVFLAAVSGGADSVAMLSALSSIKCKTSKPFNLYCLHVNHGIRTAEESRGDAVFVQKLCEDFKVPCRVVTIPQGKIAKYADKKGIGIEAAARFFRYRALYQEAKRLEQNGASSVRILTAHTKDDILELVLMRVIRGCGPQGLAAMPQNRGRLLRPLLEVDRAGILKYLQEKKIPWREDSSNIDIYFLRNRIRRLLVPLLNESFPFWKKGIQSMAETQRLAAAFIKDETVQRIKWDYSDKSTLQTSESYFFAQPEIIREEALFEGIDKLLAGRKTAKTVKRSTVRRFCQGGIKNADLGLLHVCRKKGIITLSVKKDYFEHGFSQLIKASFLYILNEC